MRKKVIEILSEIRSEFDFNEDINFIESGMLDSFDIVALVTSLDEEFYISIEGTDILPENFCTIGAIMQLLSKYNIQ
jgi:acyl carrier protein